MLKYTTDWHSRVLQGVNRCIRKENKFSPMSDRSMSELLGASESILKNVTAYHVATKRRELGFGDSMRRKETYQQKRSKP